MVWVLSLLVAIFVVVAAVFLGRRYFALRGARLVECPETKAPAAVNLRAARAALGGSLLARPSARAGPSGSRAASECLAQIERAPADCLVRTIVTNWYAGKACAVCHKPLGEIDWFERKPGFIDEAGKARPWVDVPRGRVARRAGARTADLLRLLRRRHLQAAAPGTGGRQPLEVVRRT